MSSSGHGIIGGLFGLEPPYVANGSEGSPFLRRPITYFLNVRCAIYALCESLRPQNAWLPSYLCRAMLDPFCKLNVRVRYYDDMPNMKGRTNSWASEIERGDFVLLIHYFGFPNATIPVNHASSRGAVIIEDASQGLFIKQQYSETACILYSARKFLGVPDGGLMASSLHNTFEPEALQPPPAEWWRSAFATTQMRREFDLRGGENRWFPLFQQVEETFPLGPYRSSELTKTLIESGTDYEFIRRIRRENYMVLLKRLKEFALFPTLGEETVPLGFPVLVDAARRDRILECLYKQQIYPPVHWRIEGIVPQEFRQSHALSRRILTLICDQRYTISDMERQADAFLSAVKLCSNPS